MNQGSGGQLGVLEAVCWRTGLDDAQVAFRSIVPEPVFSLPQEATVVHCQNYVSERVLNLDAVQEEVDLAPHLVSTRAQVAEEQVSRRVPYLREYLHGALRGQQYAQSASTALLDQVADGCTCPHSGRVSSLSRLRVLVQMQFLPEVQSRPVRGLVGPRPPQSSSAAQDRS